MATKTIELSGELSRTSLRGDTGGLLVMDHLVFRAALRASAKVAFTATLVSSGIACGGEITNDVVGDDAAQDPGDARAVAVAVVDAPATVDVADTVVDASATCEPPPPAASLLDGGPVVVSSSTFSCCAATLAGALDGGIVAFTSGPGQDPAVRDCCAVVIVGHPAEANAAAMSQANNAHWPCCEALGFPANLTGTLLGTCTPWGPPMPPAMPDEVA
jgi:hypothetical protein